MNYTIEPTQLNKMYKDKAVINNINIHVRKEVIYGFVVQNRAGKSTVMKMLLNLTKSNSGEIIIFGKKLEETDFEMLKKISTIIENTYFYENLTDKQNLDLHCEYMGYYNKEHISEILKCVGLSKQSSKSFKILFRYKTMSFNS